MRRLWLVDGRETNPYRNLATEEFLLRQSEPGECTLYLWQNERTVVIGKNQNSFLECRVRELTEDGGLLARRLSGGGAVFHDMGNLNFTFLARRADYDVDRQTEVILEAVRSCGIPAERSGRNDITVESRKISGNAFYETGDCCYHHGTLLVRVDKEKLSAYLHVSPAKLASKGVESVRSRVANLTDYCPELTVEDMRGRLIAAFGQSYGGQVLPYPKERLEAPAAREALFRLTEKFSSWEWNYGRKIPFTHQMTGRYAWGELMLSAKVESGLVQEVVLFSDGMDGEWIDRAAAALMGARYEREALLERIAGLPTVSSLQEQMKTDLQELIFSEL